jgi:hypothetical protein
MPIDHEAAHLRRRAAELRRLAHHLAATPLDDLARWAGPDTWVSPRAAELCDQLALDRLRLLGAVDDLRLHARWLERQADAADAAAAAAAALAGA